MIDCEHMHCHNYSICLIQTLTEKDEPHEQPCSAWGFFNTWKEERMSSSPKSTVDPFRNSRLSWSTITPTPFFSNTLKRQQKQKNWNKCKRYCCTFLLRINSALPVIFISNWIHWEFILEAWTSASLHRYPQILSFIHDLRKPLQEHQNTSQSYKRIIIIICGQCLVWWPFQKCNHCWKISKMKSRWSQTLTQDSLRLMLSPAVLEAFKETLLYGRDGHLLTRSPLDEDTLKKHTRVSFIIVNIWIRAHTVILLMSLEIYKTG